MTASSTSSLNLCNFFRVLCAQLARRGVNDLPARIVCASPMLYDAMNVLPEIGRRIFRHALGEFRTLRRGRGADRGGRRGCVSFPESDQNCGAVLKLFERGCALRVELNGAHTDSVSRLSDSLRNVAASAQVHQVFRVAFALVSVDVIDIDVFFACAKRAELSARGKVLLCAVTLRAVSYVLPFELSDIAGDELIAADFMDCCNLLECVRVGNRFVPRYSSNRVVPLLRGHHGFSLCDSSFEE